QQSRRFSPVNGFFAACGDAGSRVKTACYISGRQESANLQPERELGLRAAFFTISSWLPHRNAGVGGTLVNIRLIACMLFAILAGATAAWTALNLGLGWLAAFALYSLGGTF